MINWTELLGDQKLVDFCVGLGKMFFGGWACVTFQGEEKNSIHCVALFINKRGEGVLKYNKLVDKASVNFGEQSENEEMKLTVDENSARHRVQQQLDAQQKCMHDFDWSSNAIRCKKCGGDKWSIG